MSDAMEPKSLAQQSAQRSEDRSTAGRREEPDGAPPARAALARRQFLRATAAGVAGVAGWAVVGGMRATPARAASMAGQGQAARVTPLDTGWLFGPASGNSSQPGFDDSGFQTVALPHTVTPLSWRDWDPTSWEQTWAYRNHFDAPATASGMRAFLDFAGAMTQATPVLNGQALATHTGAYLPFSREITSQMQATGNVLAVTLDSTFNLDVPPDRAAPYTSISVDYLQPGGMYRGVKLRLVPQIFLADVFAKPVNVLDASSRQVHVQCTIDAAVVPQGSAQVVLQLQDGTQTVATATVPATISKTGQTTVTGTLTGLSGITLWDVGNPKLYTVTATLTVNSAPLHDYQVRIGFREAKFQSDGFYLNGKHLKLFGLNRHQIFPFAGHAMPDRAAARDAEILRNELNCNMIRCSHYPQAEAFYDACDELGLMCWEEAPGWGYMGDSAWQSAFYQDVNDMVIRDRNHPSVVIWSGMPNESGVNIPLYTSTNQLAHSLDDSRPTGGDDFNRADTSYVFDVFSYHDYSGRIGPDGMKHAFLQPPTDAAGKPYLVCEAVGTLSGPATHFRRVDSQQVQQGEATAHAQVHNYSYADDRYCGVVAWGGFDYGSANGNQFNGVKYIGICDQFRLLKPGAAIYQSQLDPKNRPVIQPAFYWDFGPTSPVTSLPSAMICSNLERLEVYVGGSHFATVTPDTNDYGSLPYPPSFVDFRSVDGSSHPELRIDGCLGGSMVLSRSFSSDPASDRLSVTADDAALTADGSDGTRVVLRAVDKYGAPRPYAGGEVALSVTGPANLVGDNPFPFGDNGGAGAVWLRTLPNSPGNVTLKATHPQLGSGSASVKVSPASPAGTPVPSGALTAQASPVMVSPGATTTVSATFTNNGLPGLDKVTLTAQVPSGWTATATTATTFTAVPSGRTVQASWRVSVPAGAAPATTTVTVQSAYTVTTQRGVTNAPVQLYIPYQSLAGAFNNTGISSDSAQSAGNFDGQGNSYSANALAAAGITPGATYTAANGLTFTWPSAPPGTPDNVLVSGQTVMLPARPGATALGILGASANGGRYGTIVIRYTDGTTSIPVMYLNDWASGPASADSVAVVTPYRNRASGTSGSTLTYAYVNTVPVDPSKTVAAVTFADPGNKASVDVTAMHVFAVALGVPTVYPSLAQAFNNAGISNDSDVTAANFDGAGNSYSEQALTAAGLAPGAKVTHDGITFTWPDVAAGQPDNVIALGQTIGVSGSGTKLGFLGASSAASVTGDGLVTYTDGSTSTFTVTIDNYFNPPGVENAAVTTLPYINDSNPATNGGTAGKRNQTVYVFYASVPIVPGRTVRSVTLPPNGSAPASGRNYGMHVFALGIG